MVYRLYIWHRLRDFLSYASLSPSISLSRPRGSPHLFFCAHHDRGLWAAGSHLRNFQKSLQCDHADARQFNLSHSSPCSPARLVLSPCQCLWIQDLHRKKVFHCLVCVTSCYQAALVCGAVRGCLSLFLWIDCASISPRLLGCSTGSLLCKLVPVLSTTSLETSTRRGPSQPLLSPRH